MRTRFLRGSVVVEAQLDPRAILSFSTRSHHVSQRADGFHQGCVLRLQYSSRGHTDFHNRYCDNKAYHLVTQLSLERRWRPWLERTLPVIHSGMALAYLPTGAEAKGTPET